MSLWTRHDLRDAIIAVYQGSVNLTDISKRFGGVSRRHATEVAAKVPPGAVDDPQRLSLTSYTLS